MFRARLEKKWIILTLLFGWIHLYSKGGAVVNLRYFRAAPFVNGAVRLQSPYPAVLSRRTLEGQGRLKTDYPPLENVFLIFASAHQAYPSK